ncbi:sugar phosphate isomerase/epimerase family protein [Cohnella sp.]|uniref:sugar phosphate isomerase/epimerase family protein n=1 Tax=Cohnella sp. TaxID=1883426 RepID=UPI00356697BE
MVLGLSSYTLTWSVGVPGYAAPTKRLTALDLIELTHQLGYKLIQLADNIPLHNKSKEELRQLRETAERLGVIIEVGTRGSLPKHLLKYLAIAKYFKADLVRTLITIADIAEAEEQLQSVLPSYEAAGVTLAVENHGLHTTKQLIQLFENLNSPFIGCCLDTVNSFGALESPDFVIDQLLPYMVNLHVKDFDIQRIDHQMGYMVLGTAAGSGRLDIPRLADKLRSQQKKAHAILELWTPFTETVDKTVELELKWMKQSLEYLKKFGF